ncbi:hypothetical protein, partial [Mesorhizobium sp.]|uniref:hypothetical protein n=1 Tax=Mesorhizobium sp. TaxID=1871066 RepID=UPI0025E027A0
GGGRGAGNISAETEQTDRTNLIRCDGLAKLGTPDLGTVPSAFRSVDRLIHVCYAQLSTIVLARAYERQKHGGEIDLVGVF